MSPTVPLRITFDIEVQGTPEQVWAALATADGLSAWFLPSDVEERAGGALVTHMGDTDSPATITDWEPPRRLVYEEPGWAGLVGHEGAPVTPLRSEFLVQARSGGTCLVTVVSSAFGTGAAWEQEFMTEMQQGWRPFFANLRAYLADFPGQTATSTELSTTVDGEVGPAWAAVQRDVGSGATVQVPALRGQVHEAADGALLARVDGAAPGLLGLHAYGVGEGRTTVVMRTWLFGPDAAAATAAERDGWQAWLDGVAAG